MKYSNSILSFLLVGLIVFMACSSDAEDSLPADDTNDDITATLSPAFSEFDTDETDIYLEGNNVVIETTGFPNHETVYWGSGSNMYREEPDVALTPSIIAVSGAAIFNDQEGNGPLSDAAVSLDWTGGHIGPAEYHYHLEPKAWSEDDDALIGILADGFFIYGRKCFETGDYPTDLDESGGHFSITQHSDEPVYHYHIQNELYLNQYYVIFPGDYQGTPNSIN